MEEQIKSFNPELGLMYMAGMQDLYLEVLKEYVDNSKETKKLIQELFDKKDWKNYVIKVHALKSTSLSIGAEPLSELAKELELSGKAGDFELIIQKNSGLLAEFENVLSRAGQYLEEHGVLATADTDETDKPELSDDRLNKDTVLEFAEKFKTALSEYDADAAESIFTECEEMDAVYASLFRPVIQCIRNYEYSSAEGELERIVNS